MRTAEWALPLSEKGRCDVIKEIVRVYMAVENKDDVSLVTLGMGTIYC